MILETGGPTYWGSPGGRMPPAQLNLLTVLPHKAILGYLGRNMLPRSSLLDAKIVQDTPT